MGMAFLEAKARALGGGKIQALEGEALGQRDAVVENVLRGAAGDLDGGASAFNERLWRPWQAGSHESARGVHSAP